MIDTSMPNGLKRAIMSRDDQSRAAAFSSHPAPAVPRPGDPGTQTVELKNADGTRTIGKAAVPEGDPPDIVLMGPRAFVLLRRGIYIERTVRRVQVEV